MSEDTLQTRKVCKRKMDDTIDGELMVSVAVSSATSSATTTVTLTLALDPSSASATKKARARTKDYLFVNSCYLFYDESAHAFSVLGANGDVAHFGECENFEASREDMVICWYSVHLTLGECINYDIELEEVDEEIQEDIGFGYRVADVIDLLSKLKALGDSNEEKKKKDEEKDEKKGKEKDEESIFPVEVPRRSDPELFHLTRKTKKFRQVKPRSRPRFAFGNYCDLLRIHSVDHGVIHFDASGEVA